MALRALLLRKKMDEGTKKLSELRLQDAEFEKREQELTEAVEEVNEETTEEEKQAIEEEVEKFQEEKEEHEKGKTVLEERIAELEGEISAEEEKNKRSTKRSKETEREGEKTMNTRTKFFGMENQERDAFFQKEEVKNFLDNVRSCIKEKRALTNVGLTIPEIALPLIKQKIEESSKLMKYITVRNVSGTSRQNIMGEMPEAYWDEMCAALKELDLAFYNMEMDGYKVSGYFAVCNAILEDNDVNLMTEIIIALARAIAKATDKAILYGKNVKMPMGIVTSLLLQEAPSDYPSTGREWEDLSTSHIIAGTQVDGVKLFQEITKATGIIENDYDNGNLVWVMNNKTRVELISESMGVNSTAAITAGMGNTMPVVGGDIVEFKYIPDNTIIFGYFKNYTMAERAGTAIGQSEHVKFLEDQTVFRATARYDGDLTIREAFGIYGIGGAPDTKAPLFAGEKAGEQ